MLEAGPEYLIGNRACNSEGIDEDLKQDGINILPRIDPTESSRARVCASFTNTDAAGSSSSFFS